VGGARCLGRPLHWANFGPRARAFGDVGEVSPRVFDPPAVDKRIRRILAWEGATVSPPQQFAFDAAGLARAEGAEDRAFCTRIRQSVRPAVMDQLVRVPAQNLLRRVPDQCFSRAVDEDAAALGIDAVDAGAG